MWMRWMYWLFGFILFVVSLLLPAVQCTVPSLLTVRAFGASAIFLVAFGNVVPSSVAIGAFFVIVIGLIFARFGLGVGKECGHAAVGFQNPMMFFSDDLIRDPFAAEFGRLGADEDGAKSRVRWGETEYEEISEYTVSDGFADRFKLVCCVNDGGKGAGQQWWWRMVGWAEEAHITCL